MSELLALPNPFRDNVVQDAWQNPLDVADIHADAFDACLAGIESAARGVPDSLLIYGPAGAGKTHLLTRLQRHLTETGRKAPDQVLRCVFSFVRLQTNPQLLWQHVRRKLTSDLMRRDQGLTQLQRLVAHQIGVASGRTPRAGVLELRVLGAEDRQTLSNHLSELGLRLDLPRDLCIVLEHLVCNRLVRDASAWLAGDSLPEAVLAELGLGPDLDDDREQAACQVVTALCRLAGETLPIVFCFDQVEALQRTAADEEALFRFGRMAAELHDADANVFLITCLQSAVLDQFQRAVRAADRDRIAKRHAVLDQLDRAQVERLVLSRLESSPKLVALRGEARAERFFPFDAALLGALADETPCVPRRVLSLAARAFEELQHGRTLARPTAAEFLSSELALRQRLTEGALRPADTPRVLLQGVEVIAALEDAELTDNDPEKADVVLAGRRRVALSVRNEADGRSLGPKLKALLPHVPRRDGGRLVLIRDPRVPIAKTAVKAREHLAELQRRGAVFLEPGPEALAALDALASILGDAKSGDLASDGDTIGPSAVLRWLKGLGTDVSVDPILELMDEVFGDGEGAVNGEAQERQDLTDLLSRRHVVPLEDAARELARPPERVLEVARSASAHCLLLEGPPAVLLDIGGIASESGSPAPVDEAP